MNDDGSGVAAVLRQRATKWLAAVTNAVRFAFWDRRSGLEGRRSTWPAGPAAARDIAVYLDFDMLASRSRYFTYDVTSPVNSPGILPPACQRDRPAPNARSRVSDLAASGPRHAVEPGTDYGRPGRGHTVGDHDGPRSSRPKCRLAFGVQAGHVRPPTARCGTSLATSTGRTDDHRSSGAFAWVPTRIPEA